MSNSDGHGALPDPRNGRDGDGPESPYHSAGGDFAGQNLPAQRDWHAPPGPGQLPGGSSSRPRLSHLAELMPAVSWLIMSFAAIYWASGFFFDLEAGTWIVVAIWLLSGALVLWRPFEDLLAKVVFRLRRPTLAEEARLRPVWQSVAERADVSSRPFALWIEESDEISAAPTAGHTIAITRWSLYTLPPNHLEAVLAHEMAHHLGGRSWFTMLGFWYSLPARAVLGGVRLLGKLVRAIPALGCLLAGFVIIAYLGVFVSMIMFDESLLPSFFYLLFLLLVPLMAWLGRWSERAADRTAAEMGYGQRLIDVFYGWQVRGHGSGQPANTLRNDLLSGQPRIAERIRALEKIVTPQ